MQKNFTLTWNFNSFPRMTIPLLTSFTSYTCLYIYIYAYLYTYIYMEV